MTHIQFLTKADPYERYPKIAALAVDRLVSNLSSTIVWLKTRGKYA
jgi:hypothetical protein